MNKKYFFGIDISKLTLDVRLYSPENSKPENHIQVKNDLSGFKSLLKWFKSKKIQLNELAICLEHTGIYGLDISFFLEENNIDYSMVSGYEIKRSSGLVRGKSDNLDAGRIARYCYLHRDELEYSQSKSKTLLRIRELMAERRQYVKRSSLLKSYLTEYKKKPHTSTIDRYESELKSIEGYIASITNEVLDLIKSDIDLYKNYVLVTSVIGISFVNAANILLYTSNFQSFKNSRAYACYIGVAPFVQQSGTSIHSSPRVSQMSNKTLKSDLSQAALSAITHDPELKLYYKRKIASGKQTGVVLNAVKFKLIERMFSVVKRGTPYVKLFNYAV